MKLKKFFSSAFSSISTADIVMMIVSAIVGALFSLYPNNVPADLWWIKLVILCVYIFVVGVFLIVAILLEYKRNRFDYLHMIEEAFDRKAWREVFLYGYPILRSLWLLSKVSLLIHIAEYVLTAIGQIDEESIYDFKFNKAKIQSEIFIGYLGYANNVLGNRDLANQNIQAGLEIIEEAHRTGKVSDDDYLWTQLRVARQKVSVARSEDKKLITEFEQYIIKAEGLKNKSPELELAILTSKYVLKKYFYIIGQVHAEEAIVYAESLRNAFVELNNDEWVHKCDYYIWEIKLRTQGYNENIKNKLRDSIQSTKIVRRRLLKSTCLYLDYLLCHIDTLTFSNKNNASHYFGNLNAEINRIALIADDVALQSEDAAMIATYMCKRLSVRNAIKKKQKEVAEYFQQKSTDLL